LATAEQVDALLRGDLDVGFVRGAETDPRLHAEPFAKEPLLIAVHRDHPTAGDARVPLATLANEPWVLFPRSIAPQLHAQVLRLCHDAGFAPNVVQESREVYTTVGLVGAGVGVTIVPAAATPPETKPEKPAPPTPPVSTESNLDALRKARERADRRTKRD